MSISFRIAQHKFEDSIGYAQAAAFVHLFMAFFFFMTFWPIIHFSNRFFICAAVANWTLLVR